MTSHDVIQALRLDARLGCEDLETAHGIIAALVATVKPEGQARLPISPLERERIEGILTAMLSALALAHEASPSHFELVTGTPAKA
ncbi:MAG: hypothetical protein IPM35_02625 [Myxococcales bacterium]|nr:hypothetical protein [Myxococcales bacterium]